MTYKEAVEELEKIMAEINDDKADIDQLAVKLKRATELIKSCKEKLRTTEEQIKDLFDE